MSLDEQFKKWKARIEQAKKAREKLIEDGEKHERAYEGEISNISGCSDSIVVNLVYVDVKQSVPSLYSRNPKIYFEPTIPQAETASTIYELAVNKKWADLKMKPLCREVIKSTKFYGVCAFKTYFNFKDDFIKEEWTDRIENDDVRTDMVPLKQLLKDPAASSWHTSTWIIHELEAKREDIADRFNLDIKDVTITKSEPGTTEYEEAVKTDFQYGTYYEIEDRKKGEVSYIVDGYDKFAKKPEKKKYSYDTMYDFLMYNDIPGKADPRSDYYFWRDQLIELSAYRSMQVAHARKGNSKYKILGKISENAKTQLKSSQDTSFVELESGQDVVPFQHSALDPQIQYAEAAVRGDIQIISKQAPRQSGGEKTATEVKAVEMAAQEVSSESLDRLEEVLASIATKWAMLMHGNYSATKVIGLTAMTEAQFQGFKGGLKDVLGGTAEKPFLSITKSNLSDKVKAKIRAGSTAPENDQTRMARFTNFIKFAAEGQLIGGLDKEEVLDEAVEVFGVQNDNLTVRKDNPMEESRLLNTDIFVAPKISENHDSHLMVHEQESNGSNANIAHILGHKLFKSQLEGNQLAQSAVTAAVQLPPTGQSFIGAEGPLPAEVPQGAIPPQGGVAPQPPLMGM